MRVLWAVALLGCNTANLDYFDYGMAGGASAQWGGPSEICTSELIELGDPFIDGYYLCQRVNDLVPIDDPTFVGCLDTPIDPNGNAVFPDDEVFYVYDGVRARAYPLAWLDNREAIHDMYGGTAVLVDW